MVGFIEGPEVFIVLFLLLGLVPIVLGIWALIDAFGKPDWAWQQIGASKALYVVLIIVGFFVCGIVSLVTSIVYLASTRARLVQAVAGAGGGPHGYAPPPPSAAAPPGSGWWLASDGRWYPPTQSPSG